MARIGKWRHEANIRHDLITKALKQHERKAAKQQQLTITKIKRQPTTQIGSLLKPPTAEEKQPKQVVPASDEVQQYKETREGNNTDDWSDFLPG